MGKRRSADRSIHLTEKQNLDRFRFAFKEGAGIFFVDWRGKNLDRASRAKIFERLVGLESKAGPRCLGT